MLATQEAGNVTGHTTVRLVYAPAVRARPGLYVHALRTARRRQLVGRVTRVVSRRRFPPARSRRFRPLTDVEPLWRSRAFAPTEEPKAALPGRLGNFELHYGDEILGSSRRGDEAAAASALHAWIVENPPRHGDAWHPYVVSTRVANWIAAATLIPSLATADVVDSLARQLAFLERNVEDDVLGNHVIRNAKALVLGGEAFGDRALLQAGRAVLARELPEQVLPDGGHYERSPAYHRLVLRDLLEVQPFADVEGAVGQMTVFAAALSRPDGAPALFNDGGLDIAPPLDLPDPPGGAAVFEDTGYVFLRDGDLTLAFDCGPPSPPFLPAHAHADALSLQLWLGDAPVVVDPGTSTYEPGRQRTWERGTEAHATVAVGGDQFPLWGTFRSGPLPDVRLVEASPNRLVGSVELHDGTLHRRTITIDPDAVVVEDRLEGEGRRRIVSSLPGTAEATALGPLETRAGTGLRSPKRSAASLGSTTVSSGPTAVASTVPGSDETMGRLPLPSRLSSTTTASGSIVIVRRWSVPSSSSTDPTRRPGDASTSRTSGSGPLRNAPHSGN